MAAGSGAPAREHRLQPGDTLPGLALRYGVTMEQIQRANRLYPSDTIFLKPTLLIPGPPRGPCPELGAAPAPSGAAPVPPRGDLSAAAFLQELDAQIGRSKAAAEQRLRSGGTGAAHVEGTRSPEARTPSAPRAPSSPRAPSAPRGPRLGPRPLTSTPRAAALRDAEDEIFTL
ncbi:lysM and putative peptidoglycan-binding domain-containing protein 1 [Melopsittacus undulatus]|uniref:lysM and putative peptidoglycan-binding domain-containing protein 1 n=1 Tax=Melopsittacus undulatus TaxID=13146 RepID=UPI00146CA2AE|nr:lysM and putative peptidoglycan-binding domain-containing protein 1 [Melopsittacus undulatus]